MTEKEKLPDLPLDAIIAGREPDGIDSAEVIYRSRKIPEEKEHLLRERILFPGKKKKLIAALDAEAEKLSLALIPIGEHLKANKVKAAVCAQHLAELEEKEKKDRENQADKSSAKKSRVQEAQRITDMKAESEPDPVD